MNAVQPNKILTELKDSATLEDVIKQYNEFVLQYNFEVKALSLKSNFNCQIIKGIQIAAGATKIIPHGLGVLPLYRIILRSEGNGVLSDIPSSWSEKQIAIKNEGAVTVTVTIMLVRE